MHISTMIFMGSLQELDQLRYAVMHKVNMNTNVNIQITESTYSTILQNHRILHNSMQSQNIAALLFLSLNLTQIIDHIMIIKTSSNVNMQYLVQIN